MTVIDPENTECTYCGAPYHKRCFHCHRPGISYEYRMQVFDGLCAFKGERLCPACRDAIMAVEGTNVLVVDDRPTVPDFIYNTVRDRDTVFIRMQPKDRGVDGRDLFRKRRR